MGAPHMAPTLAEVLKGTDFELDVDYTTED